MMKNPYIFLVLLISIVSCQPVSDSTDDPIIMAYYVPESNWKPELIPVEKLTHIIFSFTHVIEGEMKFRNPDINGPKLLDLVAQKERNPDLKVMIACGGWGADGFSDMTLTEEGRGKFANSASEFIEKYDLDGLDIDWEYPSISGAGTKARPEDSQNFTKLMEELRAALDELDRPQTLTFASAGWKRYYDHIDLARVMQAADFMNIMTYDQVSGVSIYTGHHTPLGAVSQSEISETPLGKSLDSLHQRSNEMGWTSDPDTKSTEKIVNFLTQKGVNPKQMIIGSAFYGRAWKGVPPTQNGLYQLSSGLHFGWYAYRHIRTNIETDSSFKRFWDEQAKAPYFYNQEDSIMLSYDDTVSVRLKVEFTKERGLGGIMFWELGNDTKEPNSLLDAIHQASLK